ncbi:MAG: hypothetical protein ACJA08_002925 [Cyclobacteriaceae bacterium]|jgi:hypothetical protein
MICGLHNWDYRYETSVNAYAPDERPNKFKYAIEDGKYMLIRRKLKFMKKRRFHPDLMIVSIRGNIRIDIQKPRTIYFPFSISSKN